MSVVCVLEGEIVGSQWEEGREKGVETNREVGGGGGEEEEERDREVGGGGQYSYNYSQSFQLY